MQPHHSPVEKQDLAPQVEVRHSPAGHPGSMCVLCPQGGQHCRLNHYTYILKAKPPAVGPLTGHDMEEVPLHFEREAPREGFCLPGDWQQGHQQMPRTVSSKVIVVMDVAVKVCTGFWLSWWIL